MDRFLQRKNDMLDKEDKSAKASWDEKTLELCEVLNSNENYYTTSSCSGKCVLIEEKTGKTGDYYLWTSHDLISFDELKSVISKIFENENFETVNGGVAEKKTRVSKKGLVKFKSEPPAIFVCCRDIEFAKELLKNAKDSGFKQSGINITNKIIGVEIKSGERLEFPIVDCGKVLVDYDYLKLVVKIVNSKRKIGWEKIEKLVSMYK